MIQTSICRNCDNNFTGVYCNVCGQKIFSEKDKTMKVLAEEFAHFVFHFEGSFFNTIRSFFFSPGKVSLDYCNGKKKKYFKPFSLFLLLVIIYLIFPVFEGLNQKLYYYTTHAVYGKYTLAKISEVMKDTGFSELKLSEVFHERSIKISKFLLIILIPLTALWFWLLTFRRRKYFFDQMVFSAEVNSVFLLWGFLIFPLLLTIVQFFYKAIAGNYFSYTDDMLGIFSSIVFGTYVAIASRRFYKFRLWKSILFSFIFLIIHFIIVQLVYKFILFNLVINSLY